MTLVIYLFVFIGILFAIYFAYKKIFSYRDTQKELVKRLLGNQVAENIGEVWGIGEDGEMANMWKKTSQKGLWFMAGSLAQCRIYSKYLALQIKAIEEKLVL